jgi:hypothetical protein
MVQRSHNKLLWILDGALISYRNSTKTPLDNQNILSVNQIAEQIKLTEMWKASNDPQFPIKWRQEIDQKIQIRITQGDQTEVGRSTRANNSFVCAAAKLWNKAIQEDFKLLPI